MCPILSYQNIATLTPVYTVTNERCNNVCLSVSYHNIYNLPYTFNYEDIRNF